jgi:hypothetical protein
MPPAVPEPSENDQNTNHKKMPAYVGAVFLYHGARLETGFGLADAKYDGTELLFCITVTLPLEI